MTEWNRIQVTVVLGDAELDAAGVFDAFTSGDTWNGWIVPHFTREEGMRVAAWSKQARGRSFEPEAAEVVDWDPTADAFVITSSAYIDEPATEDDVYPGVHVEELGETFYQIGAYRWAWEPVDATTIA